MLDLPLRAKFEKKTKKHHEHCKPLQGRQLMPKSEYTKQYGDEFPAGCYGGANQWREFGDGQKYKELTQ